MPKDDDDPEDGNGETNAGAGGGSDTPLGEGAELSEFDDIIAAATPPDYWSDAYLEGVMHPERTKDCGLSISMPQIRIPVPIIGEIQGLEQAEQAIEAVNALAGEIFSIVRADLPGIMNDQLDDLFGRFIPPAPPSHPFQPNPNAFPFRLPGPFTYARILQKIGEVAGRLDALPPTLSTSAGHAPSPRIDPVLARIHINVSEDTEVNVQMFSRMLSTYTFGKGAGTSHGTNDPLITPQLAPGQDRPWFAKALLLQSLIPAGIGIPFPMPEAAGNWVAQCGVTGELTAIHGGVATLTRLGHGMMIPIKFNGNCGQIRLIVIPPAPCKVVFADLVIKGPFEEDLVRSEDARFARIEIARDEMVVKLRSLQDVLLILGNAAAVVPIFGAGIATALRRLVISVEERKTELLKAINRVNRQQRQVNYTLAEGCPEIGPIGGAEDQARV